jgi:hypothetical protein
MSIPGPPPPAKLVCSVLSADLAGLYPVALAGLEALFGPVDFASEALPFDFTTYYDRELGTPLARRFLSFARLLPQDGLVAAKLATNALEAKLAGPDGRRRVNCDPGLLTQERLVLATGKNFSHRIYLGQGIFADLTLVFRAGSWQILPWTFPDYASSAMRAILTAIRDSYRKDLREIPTHHTVEERTLPCPKA